MAEGHLGIAQAMLPMTQVACDTGGLVGTPLTGERIETMPTLPRLRPVTDGLKPSVSSWLSTHAYRQRARAVDVETITPQTYSVQAHGTDVLLYWYAQVRQLGEHTFLWGDTVGNSPSRFVAEAVGWEIVVLAEDEALWHQGEGIVGVAYADDAYPPCRQRLHFWVAPPYRHPATTDALVHKVLPVYFAKYAVLWGVTPASRHLALRAIKRWGFHEIGRFPQSEQDGEYWVDGVISVLTRAEWSESSD